MNGGLNDYTHYDVVYLYRFIYRIFLVVFLLLYIECIETSKKSRDKLSSNLILACLLLTSYMFEYSAFDEGKPTTFYEAFVHPIQ